jgi:SAM-dependent methyltransferase
MQARIDFIPYPPTSFPFRDLLVLEQLPLGVSDTVCEIGVGSGGTTARLAKLCASVVGFEISNATVDALRYLEKRHPNLRFVVADITASEEIGRFSGSFTRAIACDTLEHVTDPTAFFNAIAKLLAPGGEFLVTFPNEPKDKMHGITRFDAVADLESLLANAGLVGCRIGAANLSKRADRVAEALGWGPLRVVRKVLRRGSYKQVPEVRAAPSSAASPQRGLHEDQGAAAGPKGTHDGGAPQTFDQTHFMKNIKTWEKLSPALNLYWFGVLQLMRQRGPAFDIDWEFRAAPFTDCQVFVTGRKPVPKETMKGTAAAAAVGVEK